MPALILLAALSQTPTLSSPTLPAAAVLKVEQGRQPLSLKEALRPTVRSIQASNVQLLQQGLKLYEAEQFSEAVNVLQQASQAFQTQGDKLHQALALNYLSSAYQQLGQWAVATKAIADSLALLHSNIGKSKEHLPVLAQALNTQGRLQLVLGQSEKALTSWEQATTAYSQVSDTAGIIGSKINQAQALQSLGLYRRALITLKEANQTLQQQPDSLLKLNGLLSLGNALRVVGDVDQKDSKLTEIGSLGSRQVLEQSLAVAKRVQSPEAIAQAQLSLGNTAQALGNTEAAKEFYRQAAATSSASPMTRLQAQLNQLHLLVETKQWSDAQTLWPQIQSQLATLSPSRKSIYASINFAQTLTRLRERTEAADKAMKENLQPLAASQSSDRPSWKAIAQLVATAVQHAKSLGDPRAQAYALGTLGGLYEQTQQWSTAQNLTQQALLLAEGIEAPDIAYRWQWQLGRILKAPDNPQSNTTAAIAAYSKGVDILKSLRSDLVAINPDVQFSFREEVEPVYRELVSLLLQSGGNQPSQDNLKQARDVIESLQLAELENFFRKACLNAQPVQIDQIDQTAAVIYPVILADRLEVIVSLPKQKLRHYATSLNQKTVENNIRELRERLVTRPSREFLPFSEEVYNWLIRPVASDLEKSRVKNLVFVLDGSLRNVPMAALYDGQQYLVEKYNIALTPGLQLLKPQPLARERLKVLLAGLSEGRAPFEPLSGVKVEVEQIKSEVPAQVLLNKEFTSAAIKNEVKSFSAPVVHLATHGRFSSNIEDTFILTWDTRVNVNALSNLLQSRETNSRGAIELLVLSACQTAAGDNRAALGLAGVAVRSGARSTLASLWLVDDEATTKLMTDFYKEFTNTKVTKAEALRSAQLNLLKNPSFRHPYFWAPFVLVGNWL